MKFTLFLKDTHMEIIEKLKQKHSDTTDQNIVKRCVKSAIQLHDDDLIFGSAREQCGGGCFASEPKFVIEMDERISISYRAFTGIKVSNLRNTTVRKKKLVKQ